MYCEFGKTTKGALTAWMLHEFAPKAITSTASDRTPSFTGLSTTEKFAVPVEDNSHPGIWNPVFRPTVVSSNPPFGLIVTEDVFPVVVKVRTDPRIIPLALLAATRK